MKSAERIKDDLKQLFHEKRKALPQGSQQLDWATNVNLGVLIEALSEIIERECAAARLEAIEFIQGSNEE